MGTGLAYRLDNVEFHHTNWTNIYVNMNREVKNEWRFWLSELGKGHLVINLSLSSKYIQCKGMRNFSLISLFHVFNLQVNGIIMQVSIARGHPRLAAESYKRTLKRVDFGEEEYQFGLHLPNASFKLLTVDGLQLVAGFEADEVADVEL